MADPRVLDKISAELKQAYQAQADHKAGLARVCSRRAAGWAIQEHLRLKGTLLEGVNALDHIKHFSLTPDLSPEVHHVLEHLTLKVAKDSLEEDAYYPLPEVDLVKEAHWLVEGLLGVSIEI